MCFYWWSAALSQFRWNSPSGIFFLIFVVLHNQGNLLKWPPLWNGTLFSLFSQIIIIWRRPTLSMVHFLSENFNRKAVFWGWVHDPPPRRHELLENNKNNNNNNYNNNNNKILWNWWSFAFISYYRFISFIFLSVFFETLFLYELDPIRSYVPFKSKGKYSWKGSVNFTRPWNLVGISKVTIQSLNFPSFMLNKTSLQFTSSLLQVHIKVEELRSTTCVENRARREPRNCNTYIVH